jgi:predicted house-cleaning noncanonical NTP pyrophosphatase (MazG superfamily)
MAKLCDIQEPGGKLKGLLELPQDWVPPFFSISNELHRRYLAATPRPLSLHDLLDNAEIAELEQQLVKFGAPPEDNSLIVRSNAEREGLEERGLLKSFQCDGTLDGILAGANAVFKTATETPGGNPIGLVVQIYRSPISSGFLSNQRRVAEEIRRWICEMSPSRDSPPGTLPRVFRLRVERHAPASTGELRCETARRLLENLRAVGRYFYDRKTRRHLEWVWDGERLWVVQNDEAPEKAGRSPEPASSRAVGPVRPHRLQFFRLFAGRTSPWQKLQCVCTFKAAGLPTTSLFILKGKAAISALAKGRAPKGLLSDLTELTASPLVIRSDIRGETTLFAPHTTGLTSATGALDFLKRTARVLAASGVPADRVCFIAHRFIPAIASAFSLATPNSGRVRIDALWGLPDGLEFCPHDSFEVDSRTGALAAARIRYKPAFLAALPSEKWSVEQLGAPWDWKPALDNGSLRAIARASARLAEKLQKPVVTMWFAGVLPDSGHPKLLPWRSLPGDAPSQIGSAVGLHFKSTPFLVRNRRDLALLKENPTQSSSVVLRPDGPHLRDESFLKQLGDAVRSQGLRIDLEGSPLSHAFYVLQRTGAQVACVDPINPKSVRQRFQKLVRDRIPIQIRRRGERAEVLKLPSDELLDVLKTKVVEESLEVLGTNSIDGLRAEMADVYEVLRALCRAIKQPISQLEQDAARKRRKLGGFGTGIVLIETEDTPLVAVRSDSELFGRDRSKVASPVPKSVVAAGRRPKTQHDRIIVPLIPAAPGRLRGPIRIHLRHLGLALKVSYQEKAVEIIFEKERTFIDPAQLSLPLDKPQN